MSRKSNNKLNRQRKGKDDVSFKIVYGLFFLLVAILPHIYKYTLVETKASEMFFVGTKDYVDLFSYYKSQCLIVLTIMLIGFMIYHFTTKKIIFKLDVIDMLLGLMAIMMILSSLFSEYQDIVYSGVKGRYEGLWVWLCYIAVVFMIKRYGQDKAFLKFILKAFMYSGLAMAFFAILQVNNYDIHHDSFLRYLIFPKIIANNIDYYLSSIALSTGSFVSLYNPNYLGGYLAMVSVLTIAFSKEVKGLIFWGVPLSFLGLLVSNSEAGLFGFLVAMIVYVFLMLQNDQIRYKETLIVGSTLVVATVARTLIKVPYNAQLYYIIFTFFGVVVLMIGVNKFIKWRQPKVVLAKVLGVLAVISVIVCIFALTSFSSIHSTNRVLLENISINEDKLIIQPEKKLPISLSFNDGGFVAKDKNEELIDVTVSDAVYYFESEGVNYNLIYAATDEEDVYIIEIAPFYINVKYKDESIGYMNGRNIVSNLEKGEFNGYLLEHGNAFTERGAIWAFFVDSAIKNPVFGSGIETYMMGYPQNDHVAKYNVWGRNVGILVDKPHSMYVQIAYGFGLIVLLLYVIVVGFGIAEGWIKSEGIYHLMICSVIVAFVISSLMNDSYIGVTVPFMVILGLSFSKIEHEV